MDALMLGSQLRSYQKGEVIEARGSVSNYVYFIKSGRVRSVAFSSAGQEVALRVVGRNNFFSYLFCFRRVPSVVEYMAQTSVKLHAVPLEHFENITKNDQFALFQMCRVLIERLEASYVIEEDSMTQSLVDRVAHLLGNFAQKFGTQTEAGLLLEGFSHQEIADFLGLSRPRVSEAIKQLDREKLVKTGRESFLIPDIAHLFEKHPSST